MRDSQFETFICAECGRRFTEANLPVEYITLAKLFASMLHVEPKEICDDCWQLLNGASA